MAGTAFPTGSLGSGGKVPSYLPALPKSSKDTATPNSTPESDNWARSICLYIILSPGHSRCSTKYLRHWLEALAEVETGMPRAGTERLDRVIRELELDPLFGKVPCYLYSISI